MFRFVLYAALIVLFARALSRLWSGVIEGLGYTPPRRGRPLQSVQMQRDPICGTFVVPGNAIRDQHGSRTEYFCSTRCRDEYRAQSSRSHGRTA
jgi:YHS domain-containing protein